MTQAIGSRARSMSKPPASRYTFIVQMPRCCDATGIKNRTALGGSLILENGHGRGSRIFLDGCWEPDVRAQQIMPSPHRISSERLFQVSREERIVSTQAAIYISHFCLGCDFFCGLFVCGSIDQMFNKTM